MKAIRVLSGSIRLPGGRLELQLERESLVSRQQSFSNAMKAKRDRLKPRSRNLAGDCKDLVANLEEGFDRLGPKARKITFKCIALRETVHNETRNPEPAEKQSCVDSCLRMSRPSGYRHRAAKYSWISSSVPRMHR